MQQSAISYLDIIEDAPVFDEEGPIGGSGAVWFAPEASEGGDPSLRLKSGYAQDDAIA